MKKIFNNKIFIVFLLTIVLILTSFSNCFASNIDYSNLINTSNTGYQDFDYSSYISGKNYVILSNSNGTNYYLFVTNGTITLNYRGYYLVSDSECSWYTLSTSNHSITLWGNYSANTDVFDAHNNKICYSSVDIYSNHDEPELVFQPAQVGEEVAFLPETQVEELLPKVNQVASMILVPCLSVFGVLLVVFLIKYKNLLHL